MKQNRLISLCLACFALVFAAGCASLGEGNDQSIIAVSATGSVMAQPDMIQMGISLVETASTTREAQEMVSAKVKDALRVLSDEKILDKDVSTASLRFNPEYDWKEGGRVLLGQRAEQSIAFSITDIKSDEDKVSRIIDRLIQINGIELQNFTFSVKESAELYTRSRELAFQKARQKAEEYAALSGLHLVKVLNISEEGGPQYFPALSNVARNQSNMRSLYVTAGDASTSEVPSGSVEVTTTIFVSFLME